MFKSNHFISILILLFILIGCQTKANEEIIIDTSHTPQYSFHGTINDSDVIAEVSIESIANEQAKTEHTTNYDAVIEKVYKGKQSLVQEKIVINQKGGKNSVYKGSPKFKIGKSYIVFLTDEDVYQLTRDEVSTYTIADDQLIKNAQADLDLSDVALPFDQLNPLAKKIIQSNEQYIDFQLINREAFEQLLTQSIGEIE